MRFVATEECWAVTPPHLRLATLPLWSKMPETIWREYRWKVWALQCLSAIDQQYTIFRLPAKLCGFAGVWNTYPEILAAALCRLAVRAQANRHLWNGRYRQDLLDQQAGRLPCHQVRQCISSLVLATRFVFLRHRSKQSPTSIVRFDVGKSTDRSSDVLSYFKKLVKMATAADR